MADRSGNWRMKVAADVAAIYGGERDLAAVLVGGSVGRGHPDRWSDLELGVFWRVVPPPDVLAGLADRAGARDRRSWAFDPVGRAAEEEFWLGAPAGQGLLVESQHQTLADGAALLDELIGNVNPEPYLLTVASALSRGVVLHGMNELRALQARVAAYPRQLAVAAAARHGQIDHFWRWQMFAERGDLMALRGHFADAAERLGHVLFAVNRRWWPGRKWLLREFGSLDHVPADIAGALRLAAGAPPADAARILTELIEAAYDIAERQLPELDVARLRQIFRFRREPLDRMPG